MKLIIDLQGFWDNNEKFIPKEIAIISIDKTILGHWIAQPILPYNQLVPHIKRRNNWVSKYHHGIRWNDGNTPLSEILQIIKNYSIDADIIYTKGQIKSDYLQKLLQREIINLEEDECPNLVNTDSTTKCIIHGAKNKFRCSLSNVLQLQHWLASQSIESFFL